MATASPTPMGSSNFPAIRRPASRNAYRQPPSRPHSTRPELETHSRHYSLNDSSDDEIPMPMKFSALTKALLNDDPSLIETGTTARTTPEPSHIESHTRAKSTGIIESSTRKEKSPAEKKARSPTHSRRVVRLSGSPGSAKLRRTSGLSTAVQKHNEQQAAAKVEESALDLSTPAPVPRTVRVSIGNRSSLGSSGRNSSNKTDSAAREEGQGIDEQEYPSTAARSHLGASQGSVSRYGASAIGRSRYGEEIGLQSSMRVKRGAVPKFAGTFMRGPARRGRPRLSREENEESPVEENANGADSGGSQEPRNHESQYEQRERREKSPSLEPEIGRGSAYPSIRDFAASGSPPSARDAIDSLLRSNSPSPPTRATSRRSDPPAANSSVSKQAPLYRVPAPREDFPSTHDQENEAPPTFKRNKESSADRPKRSEIVDRNPIRATGSPERRPLAPVNRNTPRRAAPPPPKMSVLEAATSTAGAATNNKRNRLKVNGKVFTRLDVIGRGGSSRVYRVMAENSKIFALKRVSLDDADESAIRGFKGEIDLLKKLESVERVIRLYDYELNDEKNVLSVLMEMGELDMNKILALRMNNETSKFDPSFVRHYWKEMLECLSAVHAHNIVHSDLKPHNFVLVQGRLKLIDFGIANAIQTDETVNVHRETQIGTPNYMSPESLMDSNAKPDSPQNIHRSRRDREPKLMKLGKPSDIWSLGCILYQMTYGRAPFAHIQNQLQRCQAIINWSYPIEYSPYGVGGVSVPASLIKTLKNCLNRDQHARPSAEELLSEEDTWLHPVEVDLERQFPMTEELLGRILQNVVLKCGGRTPSDGELLSVWPKGYFASLRKGLKEEREREREEERVKGER